MLMIESCRYCDYKAVMLLADTVCVPSTSKFCPANF